MLIKAESEEYLPGQNTNGKVLSGNHIILL